MPKSVKADSVRVGDRIRFSIELLEVVAQQSNFGQSALVLVKDIRREDDGTLSVVLGPSEYSNGARL